MVYTEFTEFGSPLGPSPTTKNTSATPRFFWSVRTSGLAPWGPGPQGAGDERDGVGAMLDDGPREDALDLALSHSGRAASSGGLWQHPSAALPGRGPPIE